jgi:hypothetical protein
LVRKGLVIGWLVLIRGRCLEAAAQLGMRHRSSAS